jgi:TIR domain-containing protein
VPAFATYSDLRQLAPPIAESRELRKSASIRAGKSVFLSHSSKDKEYLPVIIKVLESHGGSVYVDEGDSRLPRTPSEETAQILRDTLNGCQRLVLFVTTDSKDSRWMPWELGLGDGYHGPDSVALFPAAENESEHSWAENEYLGLYQRIVWGKINDDVENHWIVWNYHSNSAIPLRQWLSG